MTDIIVIGGGPAGMTAALYALRNGKSVKILEKNGFGGQITYSPMVENIPGMLRISGNEFAEHFLDQIMEQGAEIELEEATGITPNDNGFTVHTADSGDFTAKAVILATGVKHRMPGIPNEDEYIGNGISFCAVCDGDFYKNQTVCVLGGGNSALQEAILLAGKCREVIILQDLPQLTGEQALQNILLSKPNVKVHYGIAPDSLITENGTLKGVSVHETATGKAFTVACDGIFVAIGLIPENDAFTDCAEVNAQGYFTSNESGTTKIPGIFVAGDCRSKQIRQVTTACADGTMAALAACEYLNLKR